MYLSFGLLFITLLVTSCKFGPDWPFYEKNISVERAQELAPYAICLPSRLPMGISPTPTLSYHEDRDSLEGPPLEALLDAKYFDEENIIIELQHLQVAGSPPPVYSRDFYVKRLIVWQVGRDQADKVESPVNWTGTTYQIDELVYDAVEITYPSELRGSAIIWQSDSVGYILYSRLSLTTTLEIAESIFCCKDQECNEAP